jgi:hypothetical protein
MNTTGLDSSVMSSPVLTTHSPMPVNVPDARRFIPAAPQTMEQAGLEENDVSPLILKTLFVRDHMAGRDIARQLKLQLSVIEPVLRELKRRMLISYRGTALANDYIYQLDPDGLSKARVFIKHNTYCGAAPVALSHYRASVQRQSHRHQSVNLASVRDIMKGLTLNTMLMGQVGQAIHAGRSILLYGSPGNGKSSVAKRAVRAYGDTVWIPRAITVTGEIIRLFDPNLHEPVSAQNEASAESSAEFDERWIEIRRPAIVVGGELTLRHLDAVYNASTGIIEAPIHMKSNCGCLVVDDFGRQRVEPSELLNRWIVPLESGIDFLSLPSGRQIEVDFDQLLVFSTNLSPADLCSEAFLRRIQYKIELPSPTDAQFQELFTEVAAAEGLEMDADALAHLIEKFYRKPNRPARFCHVPDLVTHAKDFCEFHGEPRRINRAVMDIAASNYFVGQ